MCSLVVSFALDEITVKCSIRKCPSLSCQLANTAAYSRFQIVKVSVCFLLTAHLKIICMSTAWSFVFWCSHRNYLTVLVGEKFAVIEVPTVHCRCKDAFSYTHCSISQTLLNHRWHKVQLFMQSLFCTECVQGRNTLHSSPRVRW